MRRFFLILLFALTACSTMQRTIVIDNNQAIQNTFFGNTFGNTKSMVSSRVDTYYHEANNARMLSPLGKKKIKSVINDRGVSFGGFNWNNALYLFDFKDRFFGMAFVFETRNYEQAYSRFDEIRGALEKKYGVGNAMLNGVHLSDKYGRTVELVVFDYETTRGNTEYICGLYYLDEPLYQKDTEMATDEL